jgi:hypothetical protein
MADLVIRFLIQMRDDASFGSGPSFHRWLPNGIEDAIGMNIEVGQLHLWFERRGYTEEMVHFDFGRHEVDTSIVRKQGRLDAGPLFGRLHVANVPHDVADALRQEMTGDARYVAFGRSVVKSVHPIIERLIKLFRERYGQHWLKTLEPWDSRRLSLGAICSDWNMNWSDDNEASWHPFKPDKSVRSYDGIESTKFNEYLTQSDWLDLKTAVEKGDDSSLATELVTNSHRLLSEAELRHAVVEAVSALEVAISNAVRAPIMGSGKLADSAASFLKDTPLRTRLVVASSFLGGIPAVTIEDALAGIELRNRVVHEGFVPGRQHIKQVRAVLEVAAMLVPGPRIKSPVLSSSNFIAEADTWERTGGYAPMMVGGIKIAEA